MQVVSGSSKNRIYSSPSGNIKVNIGLISQRNMKNILGYSITSQEEDIILWSALGLNLKEKVRLLDGCVIKNIIQSSQSETWVPLYGERNLIPNNYNQILIELEKQIQSHTYNFSVIFRIYDEGVAFHYLIPEQSGLKKIIVNEEFSQFHFPDDTWAYEELGTEGPYFFKPISDLKLRTQRPLTVELKKSKKFMTITEAATYDHSTILFKQCKMQENTLQIYQGEMRFTSFQGGYWKPDKFYQILGGAVSTQTPYNSPWRVIIIGDKPGDLLEQNYLLYNLNKPSEIANSSWIKPGKIIREVKLSTTNAKQCVDFAVEHNLDYIEFDAGWYGNERDIKSDPTTITLDAKKISNIDSHPGLNFPEVFQYAKEKGIGIWVYVNYRHLQTYLDKILPLYKEWGVVGIKFGFVRVGPQKCNKWLLDAVKKCAYYEIMVDIHDNYRPTGYSRTLPNLLTQEGIRGNEHMPCATHNCTLPFTRFPAGAGDYTIAYYNKRIKNTHAHQIAMSVIVYSPLQFLFWYDNPSLYEDEPEISFFEELPTIWDETKVVLGKIGEYACIARKKGDRWFMGVITNETSRLMQIPLDFLESGIEYSARIYYDDPAVETKTHVGIKDIQVTKEEIIEERLSKSGGLAIIFEPVS